MVSYFHICYLIVHLYQYMVLTFTQPGLDNMKLDFIKLKEIFEIALSAGGDVLPLSKQGPGFYLRKGTVLEIYDLPGNIVDKTCHRGTGDETVGLIKQRQKHTAVQNHLLCLLIEGSALLQISP